MFAIQTIGARQFRQRQTDIFLDGLTELFKTIALFPFLARERQDFAQPVRIHPYKNHVVAYRIENDVVKIVRVLYNRQDLKQIL